MENGGVDLYFNVPSPNYLREFVKAKGKEIK
jgi:hypothetical protein